MLLRTQSSGFGVFRLHGGRRSVDAAFNNEIARSADQYQVLGIVPAHKNQSATGIDRRCVKNCQARLAIATATHERHVATTFEKPVDKEKANNDRRGDQHRRVQGQSVRSEQCLTHVFRPVLHKAATRQKG